MNSTSAINSQTSKLCHSNQGKKKQQIKPPSNRKYYCISDFKSRRNYKEQQKHEKSCLWPAGVLFLLTDL